MSSFPRFAVGLLLAVAAAIGLVWISYHPSRPNLDVLSVVAIFFLFLVLFHSVAWLLRETITMRFVRAVDYVYLLAATASLALSHLRQDNPGAVYVLSWSRPVILLLIAALALRLTRTTIEVFGWYRD
ncbi:MAG TPA: hypothetical protein VMA37_04505 [Acetobacteraceae bacterium]|nr:hypothetical protein [Acetobacteraceae bacterium]